MCVKTGNSKFQTPRKWSVWKTPPAKQQTTKPNNKQQTTWKNKQNWALFFR